VNTPANEGKGGDWGYNHPRGRGASHGESGSFLKPDQRLRGGKDVSAVRPDETAQQKFEKATEGGLLASSGIKLEGTLGAQELAEGGEVGAMESK